MRGGINTLGYQALGTNLKKRDVYIVVVSAPGEPQDKTAHLEERVGSIQRRLLSWTTSLLTSPRDSRRRPAVKGPVHVKDLPGTECSQLLGLAPTEPLFPDVGSTVFCKDVLQTFAIRRPKQRAVGIRPSGCS